MSATTAGRPSDAAGSTETVSPTRSPGRSATEHPGRSAVRPPGRSAISALTRGGVTRFARYALGSALATGVSAAVFALAYAVNAGPRVSSIAAFASGAVINFMVGRFWAWRRRPFALGRNVVGYAVVALLTALAATAVTSATDWYARHGHLSEPRRALLVELSYFATYGAMFLVKFVLLDRVVFGRGRKPVELADVTAVAPAAAPAPRS